LLEWNVGQFNRCSNRGTLGNEDTHSFRFMTWTRGITKSLSIFLNTTFLRCKHSLAKMLQQDYGRIVRVGSRGTVQPVGQLASHCAAKAGAVALTQAIADETKGTNITANIVLPRVIDKPTNRQGMGK
jgi:NAD(P)-dependent dehydrogenase (short-subunit alcohol dehydrogenase family)